MPNFTYTTGRPAGNLTPSQNRPSMQENNDSVNSILDIDLYGFNDNNGGLHQKSTYVVQSPAPTSASGQLVEYSKTSSGSSELFFQRDGVATEIQLTRGGVSVGASGYTFLPGGIIYQWGIVNATPGGTAFTFPIAFPANVFAVTLGGRAGSAQAFSMQIPGLSGVVVNSQSGTQACYVMALGN